MAVRIPPLQRRSGGTRKPRTWAVVCLCLLLAGCSATRVMYNQLDWIIVWYLNGFFSLNDEQEAQLRESVSRNMEWHRSEQLPKYAAFCRELDREMAGVLTPELLERRFEKMIVLWDEFIVQTLPDVAAFFLSLDQDQIDEFIENLEENNQELWDEFAGETAEQRLARRQKQAIKGMKRAVGRLTTDQEELIRAYMSNMHDVSEEWMQGRKAWQADFRALMRERPAEPVFTERLRTLMIDPNREDSTEYRVKVEENRQTIFAMIIALSQQFNDKQRNRLSKRLNNYARDFEILAQQKD